MVEIVESGRLGDHDLMMRTLHGYFDQYDMEHIDSVVLGCTHFVFYRDYFRELLPERAAVIDGNEGTVRHLGVVLESPANWHPKTRPAAWSSPIPIRPNGLPSCHANC